MTDLRVPLSLWRSIPLVVLLVLLSASWNQASLILDGWSSPADVSGFTSSAGSTPQTAYFNGQVFVVFRAGTGVYYGRSNDGITFPSGTQSISIATNYDPALAVVMDTGNTPQLLLVWAGGSGSNVLSYGVWNAASSTWSLSSTSLTNVGGEVDAIFNPASKNIIFAYISNNLANGGPLYWCWSATAQLSTNGVLTTPVDYDNLVNLCASSRNSEITTFYNPSASTATFAQPGSGDGGIYFFTATDPSRGWTQQSIGNRIWTGAGTGVSAATFSLGEACGNLVALFYVSNSDGSLGYTLVTQPPNGQTNTFGAAQSVTTASGPVAMPQSPGAVFNPSTSQIIVYYTDLTQPTPIIAHTFTVPAL